MSPLDRHRQLYDYERDCNAKLLTMIESVPEPQRTDARFQQAVNLAAHLAVCRENWLSWMNDEGLPVLPWFEADADLSALRLRFAALEERWVTYLAALTDDGLERVFTFAEGGGEWRWYVEGQIIQLTGHASYHRGQIALLVDQLGGTTVNTDYADWAYERDPRFTPQP
jgi:uncharacterized damage-inducible protein DinB